MHHAADEIAFARHAGSVNHTRTQRDDRRARPGGLERNPPRRSFGALVVVRRERFASSRRGQREKRRCVDEPREAQRAARGDCVFQAADVDVVEIRRTLPPDAHQRRRVNHRICASRSLDERVPIADVAVDERARQSAPGCAAREDHGRVSVRRERAHDRAAQISRSAGHENLHRRSML